MPPIQPLKLVNGMNVNIAYNREKIGLVYHKAQKEPMLVGRVDEGEFGK